MRILKYWKDVQLEPWATFHLVPEQTVQEPHTLFDRILETVKAGDYSYVLYNQTDFLIEKRE
jgi:hypothetical protein